MQAPPLALQRHCMTWKRPNCFLSTLTESSCSLQRQKGRSCWMELRQFHCELQCIDPATNNTTRWLAVLCMRGDLWTLIKETWCSTYSQCGQWPETMDFVTVALLCTLWVSYSLAPCIKWLQSYVCLTGNVSGNLETRRINWKNNLLNIRMS